jgi:programmed cell death 8 (apoptosis-inducing factor)
LNVEKAIREREPDADVLIIGEEAYVPYQRPPLSKELWHSEQSDDLVFKDFMGGKRSLFYEGEREFSF